VSKKYPESTTMPSSPPFVSFKDVGTASTVPFYHLKKYPKDAFSDGCPFGAILAHFSIAKAQNSKFLCNIAHDCP